MIGTRISAGDRNMGLFTRISGVLRANINELIARAEDPEKMLNTAIEEMQKQLIEAKSRVAMAIADEKRLMKKLDLETEKGEDWEKKAMSAVRASRDDLAVEALGRKKQHESAAKMYRDQLDSQRLAVDELKRALTALTAKLDETKRKRTILMARAKRAEAQRHVASTLHAANETSAAERLERLEARVERAEAEAEATWEVAALTDGVSADQDLADEIALLGAGEDDDLAALKAKMHEQGMLEAGTETPKALGSGADFRDVDDLPDDDEEEELAASLPTLNDDEDDDLPTEDVAAASKS